LLLIDNLLASKDTKYYPSALTVWFAPFPTGLTGTSPVLLIE